MQGAQVPQVTSAQAVRTSSMIYWSVTQRGENIPAWFCMTHHHCLGGRLCTVCLWYEHGVPAESSLQGLGTEANVAHMGPRGEAAAQHSWGIDQLGPPNNRVATAGGIPRPLLCQLQISDSATREARGAVPVLVAPCTRDWAALVLSSCPTQCSAPSLGWLISLSGEPIAGD